METLSEIRVSHGREREMMYSHFKEVPDTFMSKGFWTMSSFWSFLTLLANVWTLFSVILWFSSNDRPDTGVLFIEIIIECYLLFEIFARILIRIFVPKFYESLKLKHIRKDDGLLVFVLLVFGSVPIMSLFDGVKSDSSYEEQVKVFTRLLLLKLLRSFEIRRAFVRVNEELFYKDFKILVFFKFAQNLIYVIFITHLSTCGWLFVNIIVNNDKAIEGSSSSNLLNQDQPYFTRNNMEDANLFVKYVDSAVWAVTTLTGCSFGDVTPRTLQEVIISDFVFITGILLLAKIFSDFASVLYLFNLENLKTREKSIRAVKLCKVLGLPSTIRYKVEAYYGGTNHAYSQSQYFSSIKELPQTLFSDVALSLKEDLIIKSNLFNFGTPNFVFTMAKAMHPKVSMAGDFVVRLGEYANEMFFIKKGEVEILSSENETQLAVLREGAYFGEVGLLLTQRRSVSVRALTLCIFEVITQDDLYPILEEFPQQREVLLKVARQRASICTTADLEFNDDTSDQQSRRRTTNSKGFNSSEREDSISQLTAKKRVSPQGAAFDITPTTGTVGSAFRPTHKILWQRTINSFKDHACVGKNVDFRDHFIILPNSKFYQIWMVILQLAAFTNFFMVPYEISFFNGKDEVTAVWWLVDILVVIIYCIDIFVHMNTSIQYKSSFISDRAYLQKRYIHNDFWIDFLAFVPFDYMMAGASISWSYVGWVKALKFLKMIRVFELLRLKQKNGERKSQFTNLVLLIIFHTAANHICACIMYKITSSETGSSSLLKKLAATNIVDMPLTNQSAFTNYIYLLYWAYGTSSSGAYGDIGAVTPLEKIFQIFTMLFFRVYFAFVAAEGANLISSFYTARTENLAKQTTYEQWMNHMKLPGEIMKRVKNYNEYIWRKYRGLDENLILEDLPSSTRQEILEFLLNDLLYAVELFPNNEIGLFPNILKDFRFIQITKGEYVFKSGELAEEVYFVIGGKISIIDEEHHREVAVLKKNDFFGEMAIVETETPLRTKSARAKSDAALATLHVSFVREMWKKYPSVKEHMLKITQFKRGLHHKIDEVLNKIDAENNNNPENIPATNEAKPAPEGDWILKDLDLHLKSQTYRDGKVRVLSEAEIEFEKLKEELADILEEKPEPEFDFDLVPNSDTHRSHAGMLSMAKRPSASIETPSLRLEDGILSVKKTESNQKGFFRNAKNDESEISRVSHKSAKTTSRYEFDDILQTIQNNEEDSGIIKQTIQQTKSPRGKGYDTNIDEQMNECFLASQPVYNSVDIQQMVTTRQRSGTSNSGSSGPTSLEFWEANFRKARPFLMSIIIIFEWAFAPTNLALDFHDFSGGIMAVEIIMVFVLFGNFLVECKDYRVQKRKRARIMPLRSISPLFRKESNLSASGDNDDGGYQAESHQMSQNTLRDLSFLFLNFLYILPFQMIFKRAHVQNRGTNFFLIVLQLIRLTSVNTLYLPFKLPFFKRKYALANIVMMLYIYVLANHLFACFFILIGKSKPNFNDTWFAKIPAPQFTYPNNIRTIFDIDNFTIYTSALYWSYVTTSHVGVGDVTGINTLERAYSSIVIMLSTFLYAFLFGNLATLVDDLKPRFQKEFEDNYRKVLEYAKNAKIEGFSNKIHTYYAYIWQNSRGIDENGILKELPNSLKYDIFLAIYKEIIDNTKLFQDQNGIFDIRIFYYLCKSAEIKIYMKNDFIVTAGQEVNKVYLILEGSGEVVDYNVIGKRPKQLNPGDYFGGIFHNMPLLENIMATEMTKVAVIDQEVLFKLKVAFPAWYSNLIKHEEVYKLGQRFLTNIRKAIQYRKDNPGETTPTLRASTIMKAQDVKKKSFIPRSDLSLISSEDSEESSQWNEEAKLPRFPSGMLSPSAEPLKGIESPENLENLENLENPESPENGELKISEPIPLEKQYSNKERPQYRLGKPIMIPTDNRPYKLSLFGSKANGEVVSPGLQKEGSPSKRFRFFKKSTADPDPEDLKSPGIIKEALKSGFSWFRRQKSGRSEPDVQSPGLRPQRPEVLNLKIEVGHALGRKSTAMSPSRFQRFMSVLRLPSFLVQDEEPSGVHSPSGSGVTSGSGLTRKALKKVNLKRTTTYAPKTMTNNFIHLIGLRKRQNEHMKHLKYYIDPDSGWKTFYELLYTAVAIYSLYVVPIFVGLNMKLGPYMTTLEVLVLIYQIIYIVLLTRTAQYHQGVLSLDSKLVWRKIWERGIILDLIATIPFNLIFSFVDTDRVPLLIGILKLNRVLLLPQVPPQLEMFSAKYPEFAVYFNILKPLFYLIFGSHLIACLFSFSLLVEPVENYSANFTQALELDSTSGGRRYLVCLTFFLNIATTTGFPEFLIYNNYERCIFIICIYLGDALFALVMGWVSSNSSTLPRKFNDIFYPFRQVESVLEEGHIPKKIKKKVESYFKYMVDSKSKNVSCLQLLNGNLPETTLKEMHYAQAQKFHNFPLLQSFKTEKALVHEIVKNIRHSIYLPHDYIISRGDYGSEVFCIEQGVVHMLSPTERKVIAILKAGQVFGELGAYTSTKRLTPFVAASYCLIYTLDKETLKQVLKTFPHANFDYKIFAKERIDESTKFFAKTKQIFEKAFQHLHHVKKTATTEKEIQGLLDISEVPHFMLVDPRKIIKNHTKSGDKLQSPDFGSPFLNDYIEEHKNETSFDHSIDEYVEDDELMFRESENNKASLRVKTGKKERRFSRLKMGGKKSVSKHNAVTIRWGVTLHG